MEFEYIGIAESILGSVLSYSSASSLLRIAGYVFCALALYTIAQRRGIRKPWLAWIPVANVWILGSVSDQYRYVVKGEVKNKRKVLLTVAVLELVLSLAVSVQVIAVVIAVANRMLHGAGDDILVPMMLNGLGSSLLLAIPVLILSIVGLIFELMALYDVYTSCQPANNVLFLVLSIIPGISHITKPLFLFLCRDWDEGMPPRR